MIAKGIRGRGELRFNFQFQTQSLVHILCTSYVLMAYRRVVRLQRGFVDIMVKLVGCGPGLWIVLLQVSWECNDGNIPSKNALILGKKKSILYSILGTQNTPTCSSNTPPKMGFLRCDNRGIVVTGTYLRKGNL